MDRQHEVLSSTTRPAKQPKKQPSQLFRAVTNTRARLAGEPEACPGGGLPGPPTVQPSNRPPARPPAGGSRRKPMIPDALHPVDPTAWTLNHWAEKYHHESRRDEQQGERST